MNWLKRLWKGEAKLWQAFWLLPLLLGCALLFPLATCWLSLDEAGREAVGLWVMDNFVLYMVGLVVCAIPLCSFYSVSVWRCAFNCGWQGWGYIARVYVVLNILSFVLNMMILVGMYWMFSSAFQGVPSEIQDRGATEYNSENYDYGTVPDPCAAPDGGGPDCPNGDFPQDDATETIDEKVPVE